MRLNRIDFLRTVAIGLVLIRHFKVQGLGYQIGWIGVDLFFVLSGFLVSTTLFREYKKTTTVNGKRFLIRRGFKIYPGFYLLIAVTVLGDWLATTFFSGLHSTVTPERIWGELLFVQNYVGGQWGHTWSLAVEEHFYIFLMLGIWLLVRYIRRVQTGLLWFCFGGITLSIGFKISLFFAQPRYDFLTHQSLTRLQAVRCCLAS